MSIQFDSKNAMYDELVYDDRHVCDIFTEVIEEIDGQLWAKSRASSNINVTVEFKYSLREEDVIAMRKIINIRNSTFMNEFPILKSFAVGIFISQDFVIIKASKSDLDKD